MNVWVRVASAIDVETETTTKVELKAGLSLTVYVSKEQADKAQQQFGGIILNVDAACLPSQNEYGKEVTLTSHDHNEGEGPSSVHIAVCYEGLPYKMVPNSPDEEPESVGSGEIADFGPEAQAWFERLEQETGFEMTQ